MADYVFKTPFYSFLFWDVRYFIINLTLIKQESPGVGRHIHFNNISIYITTKTLIFMIFIWVKYWMREHPFLNHGTSNGLMYGKHSKSGTCDSMEIWQICGHFSAVVLPPRGLVE